MREVECLVLSVPATTSPVLCASETEAVDEADSRVEAAAPVHLLRFALRLVLRLCIPFTMFMHGRSITLLSTVLTYATPSGKRQRQELSSLVVGRTKGLTDECQKEKTGLIESVCSLCVPRKMGKVERTVSSLLQPIQRVFSVVTDESGDGNESNTEYDLIVVQSTLSQCESLSDMCVIPLDEESMSVCCSSVGKRAAKLWPIRIVIWLWIMIYSWCSVVFKCFWGVVGGEKTTSQDVCVTGRGEIVGDVNGYEEGMEV
ncbi:hypothetical protein FGB62_25g249 [Gracilaria domingensis]|nr:hypothetical protein FGB62_25g249 [Gracilaria domingensis]